MKEFKLIETSPKRNFDDLKCLECLRNIVLNDVDIWINEVAKRSGEFEKFKTEQKFKEDEYNKLDEIGFGFQKNTKGYEYREKELKEAYESLNGYKELLYFLNEQIKNNLKGV